MKKKLLLAMFIVLLLCGCSKEIPKLKDGTEAVVSFKKEKHSVNAESLYEELKDKYGVETLVELIDTKILKDKFSSKLEEAEKEADSSLKSIKENFKDTNGNYDETSLLAAIKQYYGYNSIDEFKDSLVLNYLRSLQSKDYAKSLVKDKEIETYYKDEIVGDRKVSHIEITPDVKSNASDEDKTKAEEEALKKAKEVITKLKKGEKFEELAKEYSKDEETASKGGDLGYINKGDYGSDEFDKEVWSLEVGKYSAVPVKTSSGYEIVYVEKEKEKKSLDDVKDDIITKLSDKKLSEDSTLQIVALEKLREEYGMTINDSDLQKDYSKYENTLKSNASSTTN